MLIQNTNNQHHHPQQQAQQPQHYTVVHCTIVHYTALVSIVLPENDHFLGTYRNKDMPSKSIEHTKFKEIKEERGRSINASHPPLKSMSHINTLRPFQHHHRHQQIDNAESTSRPGGTFLSLVHKSISFKFSPNG